jgi:hypothetical protein
MLGKSAAVICRDVARFQSNTRAHTATGFVHSGENGPRVKERSEVIKTAQRHHIAASNLSLQISQSYTLSALSLSLTMDSEH